ncbi:hypothetical protein ATANTOWER_024293, partial [Ataeniobius toweri]|nr:hypothetical protein [Ataeniobius toweri]
SSSLFPLCCTPYHPLPVHPSTPAFGRNHCYTQSLPGSANLSLHRCTCFPCSQIQLRPPKTSLKFPDQTMFPAPHYWWLVLFQLSTVPSVDTEWSTAWSPGHQRTLCNQNFQSCNALDLQSVHKCQHETVLPPYGDLFLWIWTR